MKLPLVSIAQAEPVGNACGLTKGNFKNNFSTP